MAILLLAGCSATPKATKQPDTPSPSAPIATVSVMTTAASAATVSPSPSGATQDSDFPLPTATPTAKPADAPLDAGDYYAVSANGRFGVVDRNGKVCLNFDYASVSILWAYNEMENADYTASGKAVFFAIPAQASRSGTTRHKLGYVYDTAGRLISKTAFGSAYLLNQDLLAVKAGEVYTSEEPESYKDIPDTGVLTTSGKLIIPCRYYEVCSFGNMVAALRDGANGGWMADFYDAQGHLLQSMTVDNSVEKYQILRGYGNLLSIRTADHHAGLLNDKLQWALPAQWDSIEYDNAAGGFLLTKDGKAGVADETGKITVPAMYNVDTSGYNRSDGLFLFSDETGITLFDKDGNRKFHGMLKGSVKYNSGLIIALTSVNKSDIYDMSGKLLLSIPDDVEYIPQARIFSGKSNRCYSLDGQPMPFADADWIEWINPDRFVVSVNGNCGLCDRQGNWILKPTYVQMRPVGGSLVAYGFPCQENDYTLEGCYYGLADLDGHILSDPVFYVMDTYQPNLFYVETATMSGLMDYNLHWIWSNTVYDSLID